MATDVLFIYSPDFQHKADLIDNANVTKSKQTPIRIFY